ncbi:hypothetical protein K469DRAFT_566946 [Zopfia rhizophila CBS 207.26]|uniref:Uncharacterized protein n=1 Tax=Zopfia rhizophila CBS 207.26 TaxID=1314779 RepID=A0A6A6EAE7_9PEZI|nr:hypothetical protein K469DRAFT_566946 [Zopfia rhizophila CBS 207.26]
MDLEDEETSVLEYARFHELCRDYTLDSPPLNSLTVPFTDDIESDLEDLTGHLCPNSPTELMKERLTMTKDAALLLRSIHSMQEPFDQGAQLTTDRLRTRRLKQEVPLLRSDNELDLQLFGSISIPDFKGLKIPFETASTEKDEGFEWPSKYHQYPKRYEAQTKAEKLAVAKEVLQFLQHAVKDSYTQEDSESVKTDSLQYSRNPALQPLTPPLLPVSPPLTPYIPSSPDNHLELLSESADSTAAELKALDDRIMKEDALLPQRNSSDGSDQMLLEDVDLGKIFSPLSDTLGKQTSLILKRKVQDLKVEGPLTPPIFSESPTKKLKSVTFPEMLHEYIPDLPSNFESGDDILNSQNSSAEFYKEIATIAEQVNKSVENEKLSEVDTTRRVNVPDVDFSLPLTPWAEFGHKPRGKHPIGETELEAQMKFLLRLKRSDLKSASLWHGISKLERDLHWSPFPTQLASVTIDEKLQEDGLLSRLFAELRVEEIATSSSQLWKREGLRVLEDQGDSDDELEVAEFQGGKDMDSLLKKRKLEIEEENLHLAYKEKQMKIAKPVLTVFGSRSEDERRREHVSARRLKPPQQSQQSQYSKERDSSLMFGGIFSASTALHKFMEIHGKGIKETENKEPGLAESAGPPAMTLPVRSTRNFNEFPTESLRVDVTQEAVREKPKMEVKLPKLPPIPDNLRPCSFVISSTLLQQRTLSRCVEKTYSDADFTERDFSLPHSPAKEADLILSPSTGLILTTLQQIKQRALPGQPDRSPIKERISHLQTRYERLVVLVSEGLSREMEKSGAAHLPNNRDKEALVELERFSSNMEAEVIIKYVQGWEEALARSIVGEMARWGLPYGSKDLGDIKLFQDESTWELFLRRAGFNAFAAQVILAILKKPREIITPFEASFSSQPTPKTFTVFGLPALIMMSADEREERFQVVLGGNRILSRVSTALDQPWPSAIHGFGV